MFGYVENGSYEFVFTVKIDRKTDTTYLEVISRESGRVIMQIRLRNHVSIQEFFEAHISDVMSTEIRELLKEKGA